MQGLLTSTRTTWVRACAGGELGVCDDVSHVRRADTQGALPRAEQEGGENSQLRRRGAEKLPPRSGKPMCSTAELRSSIQSEQERG